MQAEPEWCNWPSFSVAPQGREKGPLKSKIAMQWLFYLYCLNDQTLCRLTGDAGNEGDLVFRSAAKIAPVIFSDGFGNLHLVAALPQAGGIGEFITLLQLVKIFEVPVAKVEVDIVPADPNISISAAGVGEMGQTLGHRFQFLALLCAKTLTEIPMSGMVRTPRLPSSCSTLAVRVKLL